MSLAKAATDIAAIIYQHGIRLTDDTDNIAIGYVRKLGAAKQREVIIEVVNAYREALGNDFEVTIDMRRLADFSHEPWMLIYSAIFEDLESIFEEIDAELWLLQQINVDAWADDAIRRMKEACPA